MVLLPPTTPSPLQSKYFNYITLRQSALIAGGRFSNAPTHTVCANNILCACACHIVWDIRLGTILTNNHLCLASLPLLPTLPVSACAWHYPPAHAWQNTAHAWQSFRPSNLEGGGRAMAIGEVLGTHPDSGAAVRCVVSGTSAGCDVQQMDGVARVVEASGVASGYRGKGRRREAHVCCL